MVVRKPYKFLISNFKKIHLFISIILIFICFKSNKLLDYFYNLIEGTGNKGLISNYINYFIIFLVVISIVSFIIIYILMKHKKKPKLFYFVSILGYLIIILITLLSYSYLDKIRYEYIDLKEIRLYRDFNIISLYFQYFVIICFLFRGFGIDYKRFNFKKDLQEFSLEDNEEIEINVDLDYNKIDRKINRAKRELKYYYLENKLFIIIILLVILIIGIIYGINNIYIPNRYHSLNKELKFGNYSFLINDVYITNKDYSNKKINDNSYVVIYFKIKSSDNNNYNINNFSLKYKNKVYKPEFTLCEDFKDIGICYKNQGLNNGYNNFILIFNINNDNKNNKDLVFKLKYGNIIYNYKLKENKINKEYKLNEDIDLTNTILENSKYKILNYNLNNRFDYTYNNCLSNGMCNTFNAYISSQIGLIMELNIESNIQKNYFNLNNYNFIKYYGTLKYKINEEEKTSILNNKTNNKMDNNKVYFEVDKEINNADSIWFEFNIRGDKIKYILK